MKSVKAITANIIFLLCLLVFKSAKAQPVNAVVIDETDEINIINENGYTWSKHRVVMINNSSAKRQAHFSLFMNDDTSLSKFQITISDSNGNVLRIIKQKDLQRTELSEGLASDGYFYYTDFTPNTYPFVATLDLKVDYKRNNLSMPLFNPIDDYSTSVAHASYSITHPKDYEIDYHLVNCDILPFEQRKDDRSILTFEMKDLPAIENSSYNRPLSQMSPKVYFKPRKAIYYKTLCDLSSWNAMGKWMYSLWEGRDELPPEAIAKVKTLTKDCGDGDITQKLSALYTYLAQTTRYVSIQLGIGGFQPMKASDVWRLGYGDCKALSNYMKALLKAAGVESRCLSISTTESMLLPDFPNFQQMDHVILEVPTDKDTIWLECTNPQLPLGYLPPHLSGHQGLEITSEGGRVLTLPEYPDSTNQRICNVHVTLSTDGSADLVIEETFTNHIYNIKSYLAKSNDKDLREALLKQYLLPGAMTSKVEASDNSQPFNPPSITTRWEGKSNSYASITGNRLFIPSTPLHKGFSPATDSHTSNELYIKNGFHTHETVVIEIPNGYEVESLPSSQQVTEPFATFKYNVNQEKEKIIISTILDYYHGIYPDGAQALNDMEKKMAATFAKKLIFKKTAN